jgi:hypothetical protein
VGEAQATLFRPSNCAPAGVGVDSMLHVAPSHRSARLPEFDPPTAVQADTEAHETPMKPPPPPAGFGVDLIIHFAPFQRSARVPTLENPTAVQAEAEVHETLNSWLAVEPAGFGVGWIIQRVPFQRSARVACTPAPSIEYPTAVQIDDEGHDTPCSALTRAPTGFGVGWSVQVSPSHRSAKVAPSLEPRT